MAAPFSYSFLDVLASIVGPGGSFALGSGSGAAEEGISFEPVAEADTMVIGADGSGMHSMSANKAGKLTVRLLKTSPSNAKLQAMFAFQRTSSANWGINTMSVVNKVSGDALTLQQVAFVKQPNVNYAKDADVLAWEFNAILVDVGLGAGVQN